LLPDIDHTKSIIGKPFYSISVYLDRKFGHQTISPENQLCILLFVGLSIMSTHPLCKPLPNALAAIPKLMPSLFGGSCLLDERPFDSCTLFAHPGVEHYIFERSWYKYLFYLCHGRLLYVWLIPSSYLSASCYVTTALNNAVVTQWNYIINEANRALVQERVVMPKLLV